jgi:hypothetical protein
MNPISIRYSNIVIKTNIIGFDKINQEKVAHYG